jgi:hypothetical protein
LKLVSAWTDCLKKVHREIFGKPLKVGTKSGRVKFTFQNVAISEMQAYDVEESKNGIFWEISKTANYTAKGNNYNSLTPELLLEAENVFRGKRLMNPFGVFRKQVVKASAKSQSLVNQSTKQSENAQRETDNTLFDNCLSGEKETLKNYGIRLCSQGLRDTWLNYLRINAPLIIEQRRNNLLGRFPNAIFTDLSGEKFYGWKVERALLREKFAQTPEYNPETDLLLRQAAYRLSFDADEYQRREKEFFDAYEQHTALQRRNKFREKLARIRVSRAAESVAVF